MSRKQLRWRRQPRATGLAGVAQGERGWDLRYGGEDVASVRPRCGRSRYDVTGWWWCARSDELGVPLRNTAAAGVTYATPDEARVACREYVSSHIRRSR